MKDISIRWSLRLIKQLRHWQEKCKRLKSAWHGPVTEIISEEQSSMQSLVSLPITQKGQLILYNLHVIQLSRIKSIFYLSCSACLFSHQPCSLGNPKPGEKQNYSCSIGPFWVLTTVTSVHYINPSMFIFTTRFWGQMISIIFLQTEKWVRKMKHSLTLSVIFKATQASVFLQW